MTFSALSFTLLQAFLSALGAVGFGAILAIGFARIKFRGGKLLETICFLPFFLPPLIVVLSVIGLFGNRGLGLPVFGLSGILIAHWVLNIPVVLFFLRRAYQNVPRAQLILAVQSGEVWRLIDMDVLRRTLPTAFAIVFLYASLSFTIVLTLGGGPNTTTLEMAIYHAIRFDFDLVLAAKLAVTQMLLGLAIYVFARKEFESDWPESQQNFQLPMPETFAIRGVLFVAFFFVTLLLIAPIVRFLMIGASGLSEVFRLDHIWQATRSSMLLAIMTLFFCQLLSAVLVLYRMSSMAWLIGATSPLALAVGAILIIRPFANPFDFGVVFVAIFQALAMLPLIVSAWRMQLSKATSEERRLMMLLMPNRFQRIHSYWIPHFLATTIRTSALIFALSLGDLGLIPLFSPPEFLTLPMLIWQMIGSYRFELAMSTGLFVLILTFVILAIAGILASIEERHHA